MSLIHRHTRGVFIISATPFSDSGALDLDSLDRLVDFYVSKGVDGMTILGMMGEAPKLSEAETRSVVSRALAAVHSGFPVVVGISGGGLAPMADLAAFAMDKGAAGVMAAPPRTLTIETRMTGYYAALCEALGPDTPLVFQDFPQATDVHVSAPILRTLTEAHPQIVMLKHEDCPGLSKLSALRAAEAASPDAPRLSILCGNGGLYLPQELARGADGAMTGFAFPEMLVGTVKRALAGDQDGAEDWFDAWLPLAKHEQQPGFGLALRKEALRRQGAIASAAVRAPGPRLAAEDHAELDRLIRRTEARVAALGQEASA